MRKLSIKRFIGWFILVSAFAVFNVFMFNNHGIVFIWMYWGLVAGICLLSRLMIWLFDE